MLSDHFFPQVKTDKVIEGAPVLRNLKSDVTR